MEHERFRYRVEMRQESGRESWVSCQLCRSGQRLQGLGTGWALALWKSQPAPDMSGTT